MNPIDIPQEDAPKSMEHCHFVELCLFLGPKMGLRAERANAGLPRNPPWWVAHQSPVKTFSKVLVYCEANSVPFHPAEYRVQRPEYKLQIHVLSVVFSLPPAHTISETRLRTQDAVVQRCSRYGAPHFHHTARQHSVSGLSCQHLAS